MTSSAKYICRLYIGIRNLMLILAFILVMLKVCHCHAENLGPVHIPIEIHIPNKEEIAEYYRRECEEHKREQERHQEDRQAEKENDRDQR